MQEKVIDTKICRQCLNSFDIMDIDLDYLDKLSPIVAWQKFELPVPTMCPDCRKIQRLAWRNEKNIFKRKCDKSGNDIIAIFPPNSPFKIYDEKIWNSDDWDPKDYGQDFDFNRWFFEQFEELLLKVPLASKASAFCENSDYCNACTAIKNCYLAFSANASEDTLYSVDIVRVKSCTDCFGIIDSENCYECIVASGCYNVEHSYDVKNCSDSRFLLTCDWCSDCYWCFNLTNAQFHIYNIWYTKEEYFEALKNLISLSISDQKNQFEAFYNGKYVKLPLPNIGSERVLDSENVINSQNVSYSRHVRGSQDVRYCQKMQVPTVNLAMDYTWFGNNATNIYYSQQVWNNASNILFSVGVFNEVSNILYSSYCNYSVNDCFGCIGIRNSAYCILNKQYTKEEYEILVPKIIEHMKKTGEWWEFFPSKLSPHCYDNSVCQIIKPLTENEAVSQWFNWSGYKSPFPKVEKVIKASQLPDDISKIPDDILNWAIECETSWKPFRIVKPELEFYRRHKLPIPKKHQDQRYLERLKWFFNY
ncbi:MAG: hypothetical protein ACD_4C00236G0002 [uncultured bacterium (gcode 4)]|uniref:Uncharacterized protein n=1 Tax=uncultured bacterium (gcode 4) TaxID=1234023 RepID=K2GTB2_9BACT|nr:MAG: hypothetical protein ACD_4C00236G0002 [uncultured bacterium (gcode 4)]